MIQTIKLLSKETGAGFSECKEALVLCKSYEIAKKYIHYRYSSVARYKIINGKKISYKTQDYIELAKKI